MTKKVADQVATKPAEQVREEGYVPLEKKGYTPVATASKLPQAPKGGTGQSTPKPSEQGNKPRKAEKKTE